MINQIKNIIVFLFIGFVLAVASIELKSDFLVDFFKTNLINILITLLAINTATSSIVLTKLKELGDKNNFDFKESFQELKKAIIEQVVLIFLAIIISIITESKVINEDFKYSEIVFLSLKSAIFVYAIDILRDTANSIFIILKLKDK
jgi:hypothetical protein